MKELKKRLTPQQYYITQHNQSETVKTGHFYKHFEEGEYHCIVCFEPLLSSKDKFITKLGYAAFNNTIGAAVNISNPFYHNRPSMRCGNCGSYMGVSILGEEMPPGKAWFEGKRHYIQSDSIYFVPKKIEEIN